MDAEHCHLFTLPNELLLHVLTLLPTPELLPLTVVSHRFSSLILRVLHTRLQIAASLQGHTLLLECYHPSAKLTEPSLFCTYLGTPNLDDVIDHGNGPAERLGAMKGMYSRFRPHRNADDSKRTRRHPAGDVPGSRTHPSSPALPTQKYGDGEEELVRQLITLDSHELFTQLCSVTNLVKVGPRNGLFRCFVEVEEGVLRVWREWLTKMAGKEPHHNDDNLHDIHGDDRVLWVSRAMNVGLRFRVRERKLRRDSPLLMYANEDVAVTYDIEYEELLIRTSHLLLALEQSFLQQENYSSKAIVFGSFG